MKSLILLSILLSGCSHFEYCERFNHHEACVSRFSFVNDLSFSGLESTHDSKGNLNIKVPEYRSEQVKGAEAITKAAVEAAVKSAIPVP